MAICDKTIAFSSKAQRGLWVDDLYVANSTP